MRLQKDRLVRWVAVLTVLTIFRAAQADDDINHFRLEDFNKSRAEKAQQKQVSAEEALENLHSIIQKAISGELEDNNQIQPQALSSAEAQLNEIQRGSYTSIVCLAEDDVDCQNRIRELRANPARLMAHMNAATGGDVKINYNPLSGPFMVRNLYPLYTRKDRAGLILYLGVSSNDRRYAEVKDVLRAVDLIKKQDTDGFAHIGAIYLVRF